MKDRAELSHTINQFDQTDIYGTCNLKGAECKLIASVHKTATKVNHVLGHKIISK